MKTFFWLFLIFPVIATAETPQIPCKNLFNPIIKILQDNNAEVFSNYFADAVEFDVFGEDKIYSKLQAEQVVKTFFTRKSIKQITMKHCSGKEYLKYAVTEITDAEDLLYRVTIFMRIENDGNAVIQEVRLEKEE